MQESSSALLMQYIDFCQLKDKRACYFFTKFIKIHVKD